MHQPDDHHAHPHEDYDNHGNTSPGGRLLNRKDIFLLFGGVGIMSLASLAGCGGGSGSDTLTTTSPTTGSTTTTTTTGTTATTGTTTGGSSTTTTGSSTTTTGSSTTTTGSSTTTTGSGTTTGSTTTSGCTLIPTETQGPYPLLSILSNSAMNRADITEGKAGVPLTLKLTLVNAGDSCGPIQNAAVYVWHCDKDGVYSGYNQQGNNTVGQTFMRGIQVSDSNGEVTFTTVYPGWYAGRITHIHFQVYLNDNLNVTATATSQIAFPQDITQAVYASSLYASKGQNTSVTSFARDNVFSDGTTYQMATVTGSVSSGYTANLVVGVKTG